MHFEEYKCMNENYFLRDNLLHKKLNNYSIHWQKKKKNMYKEKKINKTRIPCTFNCISQSKSLYLKSS